MRHRCRMCDEAFNSTERFGKRKALERVDESTHTLDSSLQLEAHHSAESALLPRRDVVPRMPGQTGIVHSRYRRMTMQRSRDCSRVLLVNSDACIECANSAKSQEAVERRARDTEAVSPPSQLLA